MRSLHVNGVSVELDTGNGHCIERASRRELQLLIDRLLSWDKPPLEHDEEQFLLLKEFIDNTDFPTLRGADPRLDGSTAARCRIERNAEGRPRLTLVRELEKE